jgi:hypothetical protein
MIVLIPCYQIIGRVSKSLKDQVFRYTRMHGSIFGCIHMFQFKFVIFADT